jgi:hypothetical protein
VKLTLSWFSEAAESDPYHTFQSAGIHAKIRDCGVFEIGVLALHSAERGECTRKNVNKHPGQGAMMSDLPTQGFADDLDGHPQPGGILMVVVGYLAAVFLVAGYLWLSVAHSQTVRTPSGQYGPISRRHRQGMTHTWDDGPSGLVAGTGPAPHIIVVPSEPIMEFLRLVFSQPALLATVTLGVAAGLAYLWLQDQALALKAHVVRVKNRRARR